MGRVELLELIKDDGLDVEALLLLMFKDYEVKKKSGELYAMSSFDPKGLIKLYYRTIDEPHFNGLMTNFRKSYIKSENKLEQVHNDCEIEGLGVVYDYIQSRITTGNINIYLLLTLHGYLYSKAPFPESGGKFRNQDVYLLPDFEDGNVKESDLYQLPPIETEAWDNIPRKMNELYYPTNELVQEGLRLGKEKNIDEIIDYIDKCIELNAEIIRIHPFMDGNGRTARAFLNVLFKLAGIPPTYVKPKERLEYQKAMNRAINEKDFSVLKRFYYYKICDSIFELDISKKIEQQTIEKEDKTK